MANGYEGAGIYDLGYQDILGAGGGGQNLSDIVSSLYEVLREGGYYGTDAASANKSLEDIGGGWMTDPRSFPYQAEAFDPYNLENLLASMEGKYGEFGSLMEGDPTEKSQGMSSLLSLLEGTKLPSLTQEYRQNIGDVGAEIGSQMQALKKGRTTGGKRGRYGSIGTRGRNIGGGGRGQYMSDYYGLQEKQYEMERGLQEGLEEDFGSNIAQWMSINPYVK